MRTKTLLLTATVALLGAATTMAQVYSVNAVGYVNVSVPKGFSIIANPLDAGTGNNTVSKLFANANDGTTIYKFDNSKGAYTIDSYTFGSWDDANLTLVPGEGAFIRNPGTAAFSVTFVGDVMQGNLTTHIPAGFSIISSKVPQAGALDTDLKYTPAEGDLVYRFDNSKGAYILSSYTFGSWDTVPTPNVAEGFFIKKAAAADWTRTFSVNQ